MALPRGPSSSSHSRGRKWYFLARERFASEFVFSQHERLDDREQHQQQQQRHGRTFERGATWLGFQILFHEVSSATWLVLGSRVPGHQGYIQRERRVLAGREDQGQS